VLDVSNRTEATLVMREMGIGDAEAGGNASSETQEP
jgi:hypothetical protein